MSEQIAGWYADPIDSERHRYWDGKEWTEQVRPAFNPTLGDGTPVHPGVQVPTGQVQPNPHQPQGGTGTSQAVQPPTPYVPQQYATGQPYQATSKASNKVGIIFSVISIGAFFLLLFAIFFSSYIFPSPTEPYEPPVPSPSIEEPESPVPPLEEQEINLTSIAEKLGYADQVAKPGSTYKIGDTFLMPYTDRFGNELIIEHTIKETRPITDKELTQLHEQPEGENSVVTVVNHEWQVVAGTPNSDFYEPQYKDYIGANHNTLDTYFLKSYAEAECKAEFYRQDQPVDHTYITCEFVGDALIDAVVIQDYGTDYDRYDGNGVYIKLATP